MSCLNALVTVHRLVGLHPKLGAVWASVWLHAGSAWTAAPVGETYEKRGKARGTSAGKALGEGGMISARHPGTEVSTSGADWEIDPLDEPPMIYVKVGVLGSPESASVGLWHWLLACSAKSFDVEGWCVGVGAAA